MYQLSFADIEVSANRKTSCIAKKLEKINEIVNSEEILSIVKVVDRTDKHKGGAPHKDLLVKVKMQFLQYLLSDPELEYQVNDIVMREKC